MLQAAGRFGRPGIVIIEPVIGMMKPAPAERRAGYRDDEARAGGEAYFADGELEACRAALLVRVVGDGGLRLRHADEQVVLAEVVDFLEVLERLVGVDHAVGSVYLGRDGLDFLLRRELLVVEVMEGVRLVAGLDDLFGHRYAAFAALRPDVGLDDGHAELRALILYELELFFGVGREGVERDDDGEAEGEHVLDVLLEVRDSRFERGHVDLAEVFR